MIWIPSVDGWVGETEVTNAQLRHLVKDHVSAWPSDFDSSEIWNDPLIRQQDLNDDEKPAVMVSLTAARTFANTLTAIERSAGRLPHGFEYRLPARDEWRTVARAGQKRKYPWGDEWPPRYGNFADELWNIIAHADARFIKGYHDGHLATCPVYESGRNEWGVYGLAGNVGEYVLYKGVVPLVLGGAFNTRARDNWTPIDDVVIHDSLWNGHPAIGFRLMLGREVPPVTKPSANEIALMIRNGLDEMTLSREWVAFMSLRGQGVAGAAVLLKTADHMPVIHHCQAIDMAWRISQDPDVFRPFLLKHLQEARCGCGPLLIALKNIAQPNDIGPLLDMMNRSGAEYVFSRQGKMAAEIIRSKGSEEQRTALSNHLGELEQ